MGREAAHKEFAWRSFVLLAGMLVVFCPMDVIAGELGRLFMTVEERRVLDELRTAQPGQEEEKPPALAETVGEEGTDRRDPDSITVNGLVYRRNGHSTAWITSAGSRNHGSGMRQPLRAGAIGPGAVRVEWPSVPAGIELKVGETYHAPGGVVKDIIGNTGTINGRGLRGDRH